VLGGETAPEVARELSDLLGGEVFEIPTLPPSVPGLRLQGLLRRAILSAGGRIIDSAEAIELNEKDGYLEVITVAAARTARHRARTAVLATGGILGGGIVGEAGGELVEVVVGLPVEGPRSRGEWFDDDGHPVMRAGIATDADLRARSGPDGVFVAGALLAGADPIREGSLEGIAASTGYVAGRAAAEEARQ
jgi:glycerol-3-phosphate dehydrogenase subunit B